LLNTRGPKHTTRKLLASVVISQLLYAAPVWADAAGTKSYMRGVESTYRLCAIRVASAFRTISDDAVLVLAGLVPLSELVREKADLRNSLRGHQGPEGVRMAWSYASWQVRWDASPKGRWTHRLIPSIEAWMERKHGQVDFYLTQVLS
ncbi:hypothetical protein KR054_010467, partial [Drosophila jambulina]